MFCDKQYHIVAETEEELVWAKKHWSKVYRGLKKDIVKQMPKWKKYAGFIAGWIAHTEKEAVQVLKYKPNLEGRMPSFLSLLSEDVRKPLGLILQMTLQEVSALFIVYGSSISCLEVIPGVVLSERLQKFLYGFAKQVSVRSKNVVC